MANNTRYGFRPVQKHFGADAISHDYVVAASATIAAGDPVTLDSAGRVTVAVANSSTNLLGIAATAVTSATVGDAIKVYDDPNTIFEAMASTGALTDPYTTRSSAAAFDLAGTTGAFYVNTAASSQDLFKCVGIGYDPGTGEISAVGSNQMKLWKINGLMHIYGTTA